MLMTVVYRVQVLVWSKYYNETVRFCNPTPKNSLKTYLNVARKKLPGTSPEFLLPYQPGSLFTEIALPPPWEA